MKANAAKHQLQNTKQLMFKKKIYHIKNKQWRIENINTFQTIDIVNI